MSINKAKSISHFLPGFTLLLGLLLPLVSYAQAGQPIQLSLDPSDSPDQAKPHLTYEIKPTKGIEDVLTIHNFSADQTYQLKLQAVDAIQGDEGVVAFKLDDAPQTTVGSWTIFTQKIALVKPGETIYLPYSINIPDKVAPGTYQGGLSAELINDSTTPAAPGNSVIIKTRLIEPVYISVPGRKIVDYSLDDFSVQQFGGTPSFYLKFSNRGNVFLKSEITLKVEGTLLDKPYEMSLSHPTVLQGESLEKTLKFENPPLFGEYRATLTMTICEYDVAKNVSRKITTITKVITFNIIPYSSLWILLLLIVLAIAGEFCRRRFFKPRPLATFTHHVEKGETVISIADLYQVNWKNLVKLNKLPRPYTIKPGDKLELPFPKTGTAPVRPKKKTSPKR